MKIKMVGGSDMPGSRERTFKATGKQGKLGSTEQRVSSNRLLVIFWADRMYYVRVNNSQHTC